MKKATAAKGSAARAPRGERPEALQRFVAEYLTDLNGTQAYLRAFPGTTNRSASTLSARLLSKVDTLQLIAAEKAKRAQRTTITADRALQEVWNIATADPRELVEHRVGCCRYCWGKGHGYQRTKREMDEAKAAHEAAELERQAKPDYKPRRFPLQGGLGFLLSRMPNPACPECAGEGVGRTVFHDTSTVSAAAASLFAGVKETKDGLEIKIHSKDAALDKVLRHVGAYEKDNKQKSPLSDLPPDVLRAIVERLGG